MSAFPIIAAGLVLGLLGLSSSSSKSSTTTPKPEPTPTPKPPGGGGTPATNPDDYLPGTTTLKSRVRTIDVATTPTPSQFAAKYSGTAGRWEELVEANPAGAIYPGSKPLTYAYPQYVPGLDPPQVYGWGPNPDPYAPAGAGRGLLPWAPGQQVVLPPTWKG